MDTLCREHRALQNSEPKYDPELYSCQDGNAIECCKSITFWALLIFPVKGCLTVCLCACIIYFMHVYMGVDVHACGGQRLTSESSSIAPHLCFWGRVSHFNWNRSVWPGSNLRVLFCFTPSCGIWHTSCCICPFVWGLGTRAFVLIFMGQVLYQLSNFQILQNVFLIPFINVCSLMTALHAESDSDIWHTWSLILFTSKYPSLTCESLIRLLELLVRTSGMLIPCLSYTNGNQMLPSICPVEPDVT